MSEPQTLAESIHARWAAAAALCDAVPAGRVFTGRVPAAIANPRTRVAAYVRVELGKSSVIQRTSGHTYERFPVVFHVITGAFDAGDALVPKIREVFDSRPVDYEGWGINDMQFGGAVAEQSNSAAIPQWETSVEYTAAIWTKRKDIT